MLRKLILVGVICLTFGAGYFLGLVEKGNIATSEDTIESLRKEKNALAQTNQRLEETLALVKRQIQTDRIAYASLQKTVDDSDRERRAMQQKFQAQRQLLDRLKQRVDSLE